MPTGQHYATNVPQTTLQAGGVNATATTAIVQSSASWPATPFAAIFDIGQSNQEPVQVTNISGTTWTIVRAIDGTTGFTHSNGATVTFGVIGRDFTETRSHIDSPGPTDASGESVHGLTVGSVVGTAESQTLTNKTLTSPVLNTPVLNGSGGTLTLPAGPDTLVGRATTDTLTNKTLTAPVISSIVNTGTLTLPTSTDTLVGRATTDTLTNKTLTSPTINGGALSGTFSGNHTYSGSLTLSSGTTPLIISNASGQIDLSAASTSPFIGRAANSYTPTFKAGGVAQSIGNGTLSGFYIKTGRMVQVWVTLVFGSTTGKGTGGTGYTFDLPFTAATANTPEQVGTCFGFNAIFGLFTGVADVGSTSNSTITVFGGGTNVQALANNFPGTSWSTGDSIRVSVIYEATS